MFNILIIEDDSFKLNSLKQFLNDCFLSPKIVETTNLCDAMEAINSSIFDLILLDMSIPSHPFEAGGGTPISLPSGGLQIIFELKALMIKDNCIVITQYPDIEICGTYYPVLDAEEHILQHYNYNLLKCIQYSEESLKWQKELQKVLRKYENFNFRR